MNTFAVFCLCVQACLVQTTFSQCINAGIGYGFNPNFGAIASPIASDGFAPAGLGLGYPAAIADYGYPGGWAAPSGGAYGGAGEGNVAVAGELPVSGSTTVAGQVPILGAVGFGGEVCAGGAVTITGNCACGCGAPYGF